MVEVESLSDSRLFSVADSSALRGELSGHTDSVWGLVYSSTHQRLLSCSADGTVRLWDANTTSPALAVFNENKRTEMVKIFRFIVNRNPVVPHKHYFVLKLLI